MIGEKTDSLDKGFQDPLSLSSQKGPENKARVRKLKLPPVNVEVYCNTEVAMVWKPIWLGWQESCHAIVAAQFDLQHSKYTLFYMVWWTEEIK